jgi:hypothetical protein
MRYWSLSVIARNPMLPAPFLMELQRADVRTPSAGALYAYLEICSVTPPVEAPSLRLVKTVGAPDRRVFIKHPTPEEWLRLERGAIMDHEGETFMFLDAMH